MFLTHDDFVTDLAAIGTCTQSTVHRVVERSLYSGELCIGIVFCSGTLCVRMDVIHTAIWVSDLDAARSFFVDALGLEENWSFTLDGVENVYVGGEHGEIQLRYAEDTEIPKPDRSTIDHVAVSVEDTDAETRRIVEETGCTVVHGPVTMEAPNARVSFLEGPEGYIVELVEDLD